LDVSVLLSAIVGGLFIGAAATLLLLFVGRVAGISGIVGGLVESQPDGMGWRLWFIGGLLTGAVLLRVFAPAALGAPTASLGTLALAGLLVGYGTRLSNGCTSGHGVCGLSRRSPRSLAAVLTFMAVGGVVVFVVRHVVGGVG
jgi:uncharacterized membrane protein YedE/YeeE